MQTMLRITLDETLDQLTIRLEGRIAGPWAEELGRTWSEAAARLGSKQLCIDLCGTTYADQSGKQVLSSIYFQAGAVFLADTPWTQFLAHEVVNSAQRLDGGLKSC
jgi:anti-anti-sigma regulatory factor